MAKCRVQLHETNHLTAAREGRLSPSGLGPFYNGITSVHWSIAPGYSRLCQGRWESGS